MKVTLRNTREHDITLHAKSNAGVVTAVTIPGAVQNPENRSELIHGTAVCDSEHIEVATKNSDAVKHYFKAGWLRTDKPEPKTAANDDPKK